MTRWRLLMVIPVACFAMSFGMTGCPSDMMPVVGDGPVAPGISGHMGDVIPTATPEQMATFERGKAVFLRRFNFSDGLGPAFNVTFCGACHERPVPGGSSALYRNFFLAGRLTADGAFIPSESAGMAGGVLRLFNFDENEPFRPAVPDTTTIFAQRNAIPFFGAGLVAEITDEEILTRADPDDADGDGISGRANFEAGFVGRFGRKCQTASIEGFIRGPLFNHLGITTNALSDAQRAALPVDSSSRETSAPRPIVPDGKLGHSLQVAVSDAATVDDDDVPDPEMSTDDLFDLVSFAMLLAIPTIEDPLSDQAEHGRQLFHQAGCSDCHVPRINGPRGPLPMYSDFLIHDMGAGLADGIVQSEAINSEFRTHPLLGIGAVGPYLHDGRAETIQDAILAHGGEAQAARDAYAALNADEKTNLREFLLSLGGRDQTSRGLVQPGTPIPAVGTYGGPFRALNAAEEEQYLRGRAVFDSDFGIATGVGAFTGADGAPRFNGDSCRACHFDPVIGGSGPRGVNVMRHGTVDGSGNFTPPPTTPNTILHREVVVGSLPPRATADINVFEPRQTPHNFGMGLVDAISDATIQSNEDPMDTITPDGISGRAHVTSDGRIGRFGWKAQVPSIAEFVGDAMAAEMGITLPAAAGLSFSITSDTDAIPDPELTMQQTEDIIFFLRMMGGPPRQSIAPADSAAVAEGDGLFTTIGCDKCHIRSLSSSLGDVPLFSDLLLHEILPAGTAGIVDDDAGQLEFRTAPLWGLAKTAPYFHNGMADDIDSAIRMHDGEALGIRQAYEALALEQREAVVKFLNTL